MTNLELPAAVVAGKLMDKEQRDASSPFLEVEADSVISRCKTHGPMIADSEGGGVQAPSPLRQSPTSAAR